MYFQKMNCKLSFFNTADFSWGSVSNGSATGSYKEIVDDMVDIVGGSRILVMERIQVSEFALKKIKFFNHSLA